MCLLQNLAYDADDTSSVWTAINVIEKERDHLSNTIVQIDGCSIHRTISNEDEEDTGDLSVFSTCISIMAY
jgi:hypothetical protein